MPASKSSASSRRSKSAGGAGAVALCFLACLAVLGTAAAAVYRNGSTLYYGDAEAHLNIARRLVDNRTPGIRQLGTTWLPLPHLLLAPLVRNNWLWQTGLAGAFVSVPAMALAAVFLFAAMRRLFGSLAGGVAVAVLVLNPNMLYLSAIPMTEPLLLASLCGLLYYTVCFGERPGWGALVGTGASVLAGTLTRYEMWFLIPFVALYILLRSRRPLMALAFCAVAATGPALWLAHNRWQFGDALYFYRGPWSALAIQGNQMYPGKGDWLTAARYYLEAVRLATGWPTLLVAAAGFLVAVSRKKVWPVLLLLLPAAFYIWSIHSSGTPLFVPTMKPFSFYNTRYAIPALPLLALCAAALARPGKWWAALVLAAIFLPFAWHPLDPPVTWRESDVNSRARREWTADAVSFLKTRMKPGETVFTSFGDLTGIFRRAGIPLRATLTGDNDSEFDLACARPDLYLKSTWAVAQGGDVVQTTLDRWRLRGPRYRLVHRIMVKGAPVIEIYRRANSYDDPLP